MLKHLGVHLLLFTGIRILCLKCIARFMLITAIWVIFLA